MRFFEQFVPGPYIAWLAVEVVLQVSAVILVAMIVARTVFKRRAAARHGLWLCCLVCVFLSPAVAVALDRAGIALAVIPWTRSAAPPAVDVVAPLAVSYPLEQDGAGNLLPEFSTAPPGTQTENTHALSGGPIELSGPVAINSSGSQALKIESRVRSSTGLPALEGGSVPPGKLRVLLGGLVLTWVLGIVVGLVRLMLAGRQLGRLRRSLEALEAGEYGDVFYEVRHALGLESLPPVYTSAAVSGPVAIGILRGGIVLPPSLASTISPRQLRDVLIHEVAHTMRRDPLIALLQRIAGVLYWPHPLVHVLNVQLALAGGGLRQLRALCWRSLWIRTHAAASIGDLWSQKGRGRRPRPHGQALDAARSRRRNSGSKKRWDDQCQAGSGGSSGSRPGGDLRCDRGDASDRGSARGSGDCGPGWCHQSPRTDRPRHCR